MIRPLTCITMILAGGAGLYLYQVKHQAQMLDRDIDRTVQQTQAARERIRMLHAEWALLNEPERLQDLAEHFLQLKPMAPSQFVRMTDLASRLPPPGMPNTAPAQPVESEDSDEGDDAPTQAQVAPPPVAAAASKPNTPKLAAKTEPKLKIASLAPMKRDDVKRDEPKRDAKRDTHSNSQLASATPHAAPRASNMVGAVAAPVPVYQHVYAPAPTLQTVSAYSAPHPVSVAASSLGGSSLGMARNMAPPPVPVATAAYR